MTKITGEVSLLCPEEVPDLSLPQPGESSVEGGWRSTLLESILDLSLIRLVSAFGGTAFKLE